MHRPLAVVAVLLVLTACGSDGTPGAAEPATAPAASAPAGSVSGIGASPEGIVYDARTNLLAIAVRKPSRLVLVDASTLAVRRTVALPGTVRHLQLAEPGGPVLVPDESAAELIEVSLPDGHKRVTSVGKQPHDAARVNGGEIVVGNEFGKSISFVENGTVLQTVPGPQQPGGIVGAGNTVAVIDVGKFTLSTYDVTSRAQRAIVDAGTGPTHGVLLSRDRVAVVDTRGNALLVFSLNPLRQLGELDVPGTPYGVAVDGDVVWLTLTSTNEVVGLDVSTSRPKLLARYPTVRQPNTIAVDAGSHHLWITGTAAGQLQTITR